MPLNKGEAINSHRCFNRLDWLGIKTHHSIQWAPLSVQTLTFSQEFTSRITSVQLFLPNQLMNFDCALSTRLCRAPFPTRINIFSGEIYYYLAKKKWHKWHVTWIFGSLQSIRSILRRCEIPTVVLVNHCSKACFIRARTYCPVHHARVFRRQSIFCWIFLKVTKFSRARASNLKSSILTFGWI